MSMNEVTEKELNTCIDQKLCEIADILLGYYNPCKIEGSGCRAGNPNPCCLNAGFNSGMCAFWQNDKCQYSNCDCRLWICETAVKATDIKCVQALRILEVFAGLFGLVKPPMIGDPYTGVDKIA